MSTEGECKQLEWTWMTSGHSIQYYITSTSPTYGRQRFSLQGITRVVGQSRAPEDIALVITTCEDAYQA